MLTQFINSAVIIDDNDFADQQAQVLDNLMSFFKEQDIAVSYFSPTELKDITFKKNRQLLFLDLKLDASKDEKRNIQEEIRPLLKKILPADFGNYGIVMWTKHIDYVDLLKEKIQDDREKDAYPAPLFIVGLDKSKYITDGSFDTLFTDIETVLNEDTAATFFLEWSNSVKQAENATVSKIYSLMPDYKTMSDDFSFVLKKLALNHTGIDSSQVGIYPLHEDAFKSFDDILHAELINCQKSGTNPFLGTIPNFSNQTNLPKIYAQLNAAILIDENNINQSIVVPGNVYEIKDAKNKFKCSVISDKINEITTKLGAETDKNKKVNLESEKQILENVKYIAIEITPPCDFSNNKRLKSRLLGGFLIDVQMIFDVGKQKHTINKQIENIGIKSEHFHKEVFPLQINNLSNPQLFVLDFRYFGDEYDANLIDTSKYKILFRAKPKLFADVLQKFSSHAARLGLSVIHS